MSNNENWIFGSALLGLSLVLGAAATAMDPDKIGFSIQSSAPPSLPAFFDGTRLPSLQDTWKLGEGEPASAQSDTAAIVAPKPANENKPAASIGVETAVPAPIVKQTAIPPIPIRAPRIAQVAKRRSPPATNSSNGDKSIGALITEAMQNIGSFVGL